MSRDSRGDTLLGQSVGKSGACPISSFIGQASTWRRVPARRFFVGHLLAGVDLGEIPLAIFSVGRTSSPSSCYSAYRFEASRIPGGLASIEATKGTARPARLQTA